MPGFPILNPEPSTQNTNEPARVRDRAFTPRPLAKSKGAKEPAPSPAEGMGHPTHFNFPITDPSFPSAVAPSVPWRWIAVSATLDKLP